MERRLRRGDGGQLPRDSRGGRGSRDHVERRRCRGQRLYDCGGSSYGGLRELAHLLDLERSERCGALRLDSLFRRLALFLRHRVLKVRVLRLEAVELGQAVINGVVQTRRHHAEPLADVSGDVEELLHPLLADLCRLVRCFLLGLELLVPQLLSKLCQLMLGICLDGGARHLSLGAGLRGLLCSRCEVLGADGEIVQLAEALGPLVEDLLLFGEVELCGLRQRMDPIGVLNVELEHVHDGLLAGALSLLRFARGLERCGLSLSTTARGLGALALPGGFCLGALPIAFRAALCRSFRFVAFVLRCSLRLQRFPDDLDVGFLSLCERFPLLR